MVALACAWMRRAETPFLSSSGGDCSRVLHCRALNLSIAETATILPGSLGRSAAFSRCEGWLWVLVGADAPIINLTGRYFDNKLPMYFLGASRPSPGELAYTEAAMFGL